MIFDYYSVVYSVIAQYTNMTSNNLYAESIFKYLGKELFDTTTEYGSLSMFGWFNLPVNPVIFWILK